MNSIAPALGLLVNSPIFTRTARGEQFLLALTWRQVDVLKAAPSPITSKHNFRTQQDLYHRGLLRTDGSLTKAGEAVLYLLGTTVGEQQT